MTKLYVITSSRIVYRFPSSLASVPEVSIYSVHTADRCMRVGPARSFRYVTLTVHAIACTSNHNLLRIDILISYSLFNMFTIILLPIIL